MKINFKFNYHVRYLCLCKIVYVTCHLPHYVNCEHLVNMFITNIIGLGLRAPQKCLIAV